MDSWPVLLSLSKDLGKDCNRLALNLKLTSQTRTISYNGNSD